MRKQQKVALKYSAMEYQNLGIIFNHLLSDCHLLIKYFSSIKQIINLRVLRTEYGLCYLAYEAIG